jgi:hypothetical protein
MGKTENIAGVSDHVVAEGSPLRGRLTSQRARLNSEGLREVLESLPYVVEGFAVVPPGEELGVLWKRRASDGVPWFAVNGLDPNLFTFTNPEGDKWAVWADLDEYAVTGSLWDWEMRVLAPVNYLSILETLNMSRVFLGHAFRYEEKSWLILVATTLAKKLRGKGNLAARAGIVQP